MRPTSPPIVAAVYPDLHAAERAVRALLAAGFPKEALSVIAPAGEDGTIAGVPLDDPAGSQAGAAAAVGGTIGALLGGLTLAAGMAVTGGLGLFAVGPLAVAAAGGGAAGGFIGAMITRGFEPELADYYDQALRRGQILVGVESLDGAVGPALEQAERIFVRTGAAPVELPKD